MTATSVTNAVRISPRKVSVVAALIRGRSVEDALVILEHTPRRAALPIKKTVLSARANAEHNHNFKPDSLMITEIIVNPGPRLKRFRPAARGRAMRFARKTSRVKVVVDGEQRVAKKASPTKTDEEKK